MIYNLGNMWERNVGISFIGMARVVVITCLGTLADSMITFGMEGEKTGRRGRTSPNQGGSGEGCN